MLGANDLGKWMIDVISDGIKDTVVVFAQDVAPDTVFDDIGANALIRQYLDSGGRVVWIGDVPFSYQGKKGAKKVEELQKDAYWRDLRGSNINILSVIPVFVYAPRRAVKIKFIRGKLWGLKTKWSSLRPIVSDVKTGEFVKPLAKTEALIANSQIKYDKHGVKSWLKRFFERVKSVEIGKGGVGIELVEKDKKNNQD